LLVTLILLLMFNYQIVAFLLLFLLSSLIVLISIFSNLIDGLVGYRINFITKFTLKLFVPLLSSNNLILEVFNLLLKVKL
jgi:hypothetical protein